VPRNGEVGEKRLDLRRSQSCRVTLAVKPDEAFNPIGIRLLGSDALVLETDLVPNTIEQTRWISVSMDVFGWEVLGSAIGGEIVDSGVDLLCWTHD
jgi:hypothetical protein